MALFTRYNSNWGLLFRYTTVDVISGRNSETFMHEITEVIDNPFSIVPLLYIYAEDEDFTTTQLMCKNPNADVFIKYDAYEDSGSYYVKVRIINNKDVPIYAQYVFFIPLYSEINNPI